MSNFFKIYNEKCEDTMDLHIENKSIDLIITSPPYNMTKRKGGYADSGRYDEYNDWKEENDYLKWTTNVFNKFDKILKDNKLIIYNFSYSIENPSLPYKLIYEIEINTNFTLVDSIIWKKKCGLPFPANKYRLSRNWEYIWVFCKKSNIDNFDIFKPISKVGANGQTYYRTYYNFIEAKNNDIKTSFNQATYSTELIDKILEIYGDRDYVVYDPFMGTGTTGVSCKKNGTNFIGSEISKLQCDYSIKRIEEYNI